MQPVAYDFAVVTKVVGVDVVVIIVVIFAVDVVVIIVVIAVVGAVVIIVVIVDCCVGGENPSDSHSNLHARQSQFTVYG